MLWLYDVIHLCVKQSNWWQIHVMLNQYNLFFITKDNYLTNHEQWFYTGTQMIMWISRNHACCFWLLGKGCKPPSRQCHRVALLGRYPLAKLAPHKVMFCQKCHFYLKSWLIFKGLFKRYGRDTFSPIEEQFFFKNANNCGILQRSVSVTVVLQPIP